MNKTLAMDVRAAVFAALLLVSLSLAAGMAGAQENTPSEAAPSTRAADPAPTPTLRNRADGSIEELSGNEVVAIYPPGSLVITRPDEATLQRKAEREEEERQIEEAIAESERIVAEEQAAEAAEAEAEAEKRAEKQRQTAAKQQAAFKATAITVLNGNSGIYQNVVPLDTAREIVRATRPAKAGATEAAKLEERSVSILNLNTGGYIQAIPLEELVDEKPSTAEAAP
jgi:hypothetical protein